MIIFLAFSTHFASHKIAVSFVTSMHLYLKCIASLWPYCICVKTVDQLQKKFRFTVRLIISVIKMRREKVIASEANNNVRVFKCN